jgi:hypothetical protein
MVCPGAGGWRATLRPKNELQYGTVSCKNDGVLNIGPARDGDRERALQIGGNSCQKFIGEIGCGGGRDANRDEAGREWGGHWPPPLPRRATPREA